MKMQVVFRKIRHFQNQGNFDKIDANAARWRSGNAGVCKTSMRRFNPGTRLRDTIGRVQNRENTMTRSPEFEPEIIDRTEAETEISRREAQKVQQEETNSDDGYSETKQAQKIESGTDVNQLGKQSTRTRGTRNEKALEAYTTVSEKLKELVEEYTKLLEEDLHRAKRLLEEIQKTQETQAKLFKKLIEE